MKDQRKNRNPNGKGGFRENPQNINRKGRPTKGNSFKEILERELDGDFIETKNGKSVNRGNTKELLVQAWIHYALAGSWQHLRSILEIAEGSILPEENYIDERKLKLFLINQIELRQDFKFDGEGNLINQD